MDGREDDVIDNSFSIVAHSLHYVPDRNEWWAWSDWEIWSLYKDGSHTLLNRNAQKMRSVPPLNEFGFMVIVSNDAITAFNPTYVVSREILAEENPDDIIELVVLPKRKEIYVLKVIHSAPELTVLEY